MRTRGTLGARDCARDQRDAATTPVHHSADYFSANASDYGRYRPTYPNELCGFLSSLSAHRTLALDCGCGTGQLAVRLAQYFGSVVAIDASVEQIGQAHPHPRIAYRVARAEATGLPDRSVDLLTAAQSVHWFDLQAFFAEASRVLRPTGVLALISYGVIEVDHPCNAVVSDLYSRVLAPYWPPERRLVDTGYKQMLFPMAEERTPSFIMRARWTADELIGYLFTWSAVRVAEREGQQQVVQDALNSIRRAAGAPDEPIDVRWPINLRVGRPTVEP